MNDRQKRLLDAAIRVLGNRGLRQLTHRTVDAEAGLPIGSASNHYRTREALVVGVLDRLMEREATAWQRIAGVARPVDGREFAGLIGRMIRELCEGDGRVLTLARHAIFHEAAFDPRLQHKIAASRAAIAAWGAPWLAGLGSKEPEAHFTVLLALIDGLLNNQLASPDPDFDPEGAIAVVVKGVVGA